MKYLIHNQLTGMQEEALTFEDAKLLQDRIRKDYYKSIESIFTITVIKQNDDGSWTQSVADSEGNLITIGEQHVI